MSNYDGSWDPDFPDVMHFIDHENEYAKPWKLLENHPCYNAAKNNEDKAAAFTLVHSLLNTKMNRSQLESLKQNYSNVIVVPVHAIESRGKNRIPAILAEYICLRTGFDVDVNIVQTNRVHRTGSDEWHRFAFRPAFDGSVIPEKNYILVDDVFAHGGSFNELRLHIEKNGGKVIQTAALSLGGHGNKIAPEAKLMNALIDKFGENNLNLFLKEINLYDGNYKALTNPETFALGRSASLDFARDRILAARQKGNSYLGAEGLQETQSQTAIIAPEHEQKRGFRR